MIQRFLSSALVVFISLGLNGCQSSNLGPQVDLRASDSSYPLDAKTLIFRKKYDGPTTNTYVNELMDSVDNWARAHFVANGSSGQAVIELDEIVGQDVLLDNKSSSMFHIEQAGRLEAAIALKISIQDDTGFARQYLEVRTNRSQTYPEKATLREKEQVWRSVINAILNALNDKLKGALN
jgi:hypothetical protein